MRSSLELQEHIRRTWAGERTPVLNGNVGDLHVGPDETIIDFEALLAYTPTAGQGLIVWSPARGTVQQVAPGECRVPFSGPTATSDVAAAVAALQRALDRCDAPVVVAVDWADAGLARAGDTLNPAVEALSRLIADVSIARRGHRFVVVDRMGAPESALGRLPQLHRVAVTLPNLEERMAFLNYFQRHCGDRFAVAASDDQRELVARASNGLSLRRLLALMGELHHTGGVLDVAAVAPVKFQFLLEHTEGALRPLTSTGTFEQLAGLHNVRLLLGEHSTGTPLRHLLLAGPPGVGKSSVVSAIGGVLGLSVVALGDTRSQYVGESERRTQLMISTAESMAPVILFVDEVDQALAGDDGPSGDSGVTKRINKQLWEWTGQVAGEQGVLLIGATNRPSALGTRVDDRFTTLPVLHPDPTEAADIARLSAAALGRTIDADATSRLLHERSALYTGRTIAEMVRNAVTLAEYCSDTRVVHLDGGAVGRALDDLLPWGSSTEQEYMALDAIRHTRRRRYLPWEAARIVGVPYHVPEYVRGLLDSEGALDLGAVDDRMRELQPRHG